MALYCGIDLHSRDSWLAILDDELKVIREAKVGNDLETILEIFEPYREDLEGIAVESTFNWYWLVDGLEEAGYQMHLVNTWAVKQWEGLKYSDDRHDARWLAHLLKWVAPVQRRDRTRPYKAEWLKARPLRRARWALNIRRRALNPPAAAICGRGRGSPAIGHSLVTVRHDAQRASVSKDPPTEGCLGFTLNPRRELSPGPGWR